MIQQYVNLILHVLFRKSVRSLSSAANQKKMDGIDYDKQT